MKTFAIGDIHGCYDELMALMDKLKKEGLNPEKDRVVFLGDYVDRGPKTKQVVDQLMKWEKTHPHWKFLYGNHESLMLDALGSGHIYQSYDLWWNQGGKETAHSYFPEGMNKYDMAISQPKDHIIPEHIAWLKDRPLFFEDDKYFFVHAGIPPYLQTLDNFKQHCVDGDPKVIQDAIWIRDEFIFDKTDWGKKIIFGHTADDTGRYQPKGGIFQPIIRKNKIGIDTAGGNEKGFLTAIELPSEKIYSVAHIGIKDGN